MAPRPPTPPADQGSPKKEPLVLQMRKATRRAHNIANMLILSKLVVVLTDARLYGQALSCFHPVYKKLEELLQLHKDAPELQPVMAVVGKIPSRAAAMEEDLLYLLGPDWRSSMVSSPAGHAYAQHLQSLSDAGQPLLLLPYAFSLHVPILLGFMAARIQRNLQLPEGKGLAFFQISDKPERLAALRGAVNRVGEGLSPQQRQAVVAEALEQFRLNNSVVAGFSLGWRAVGHALEVIAKQLPTWLLLGLLALALAVLWAGLAGLQAVAAGM